MLISNLAKSTTFRAKAVPLAAIRQRLEQNKGCKSLLNSCRHSVVLDFYRHSIGFKFDFVSNFKVSAKFEQVATSFPRI